MKDVLIDFSCKSSILLEDENGVRVPMSEPYFRSEQIAPGTWKILSDGDFSYLLKGANGDALLIDSGYGAGNIRAYCESLVGHPVARIVNTHHHFDHTALDAYFDLAYMAEESVTLATIPFPSFEGIDFPRNYTVQIVEDGETIPLQGRDLLVLKIPDHAVGSIALLDRAQRILFSGDELGMPFGKPINTTVENWARLLEKLASHRGEYDVIYGGGGAVDPDIVQKQLDNCRAVLGGAEGIPHSNPPFNSWQQTDGEGRTIWKRRLPHPGDGPKEWHDDSAWKRRFGEPPEAIIYDIRKTREK
ncbi:MAG: MBL fold metallo-hydrolase [Candidatus Faecivicinus sp.]